MTSYTTISNALVAVGAKPFATTVQAFRDNPIAIAEADSTAPVNQTVWHPYNKVTVGDANDGRIYNFATDGTVASVVSPDFADGYEYRFRVNRLSHDSAGSTTLQIELFLTTTAAYGPALIISSSQASSFNFSGYVEVLQPRETLVWTPVRAVIAPSGATGNSAALVTDTFSVHTTAQKRTRARISFSVGSIDLGQIYMDRRRVIY